MMRDMSLPPSIMCGQRCIPSPRVDGFTLIHRMAWVRGSNFHIKRIINNRKIIPSVDSPLMYQHGWKRPVDYVLAFSKNDVTDVTWRYSNEDRQALLRRRTRCPEKDLEAKLLHILKFLQKGITKPRKQFLIKRMLLESLQLFPQREPTEDEKRGRSSGDLAWRESRGEHSVDAVRCFSSNAKFTH